MEYWLWQTVDIILINKVHYYYAFVNGSLTLFAASWCCLFIYELLKSWEFVVLQQITQWALRRGLFRVVWLRNQTLALTWCWSLMKSYSQRSLWTGLKKQLLSYWGYNEDMDMRNCHGFSHLVQGIKILGIVKLRGVFGWWKKQRVVRRLGDVVGIMVAFFERVPVYLFVSEVCYQTKLMILRREFSGDES